LLQGWTIRLRQFGKEDWLSRLTGRLPRKGQVPSGASDEERDFFERFAVDKSKDDKSKSGSSTTGTTTSTSSGTAEVKKRDSGMKRFTVPIDFAGKKYPFFVYVMTGPRGYAEVQDQFRWVEEIRGGKVPQEVRDSFRRLNEIAKENNVDFMELTVYALGTATTEGGGTGGSGTGGSGTGGSGTGNSGTKVESQDNSSKSSSTNSGAGSTQPSGISPAGTTGSEKGASEKGASDKSSAFGLNNGFSNPMGGPKTKMNSNGRTPPPEKKGPDNMNGKRPSPPTKTKR
jgi:hypothetical protein